MLEAVKTTPQWDFPVHTCPVFAEVGPYTKAALPGYKSVVRSDTGTPLSVVGQRYEVFTHQEAARSVQPIIQHFGTPVETHSVEKDGAKVVLTYTFKNHTLDVQNRKLGDKVALELNVINSYNQQTSLEFKIGARVLRCLNGMTTFRGGLHLRFRHTSTIRDLELPEPGLIWDMFTDSKSRWNEWGETDVTDTILERVSDQSKKMQIVGPKMLTKFEGEFSGANTVWDLYNVYTRVLTHEMGRVRQSSKLERFDKLNHIFDRALSANYSDLIQ